MKSFNGKSYAVFDIDGTLYRWQLFHELVQELTFTDVFPDNVFHDINERWNKWRGGSLSFDAYESYIVETLMRYLPLIPVTTFLATCDKVVSQSQHKTYHYTRRLLQDLKAKGYVIIAISGSQQELLDAFGTHYGFDIVIGAAYEHDGKHFSGRITRPTVGRKHIILQELIKTHGLSPRGSRAIGDSEGDIPVLELVEQPVAFNPSAGLLEHARSRDWPIVIERKNIAYRLETRHDELVLAETITY
jgi:HAD superfamily hydrolase (TIGR01490 family)